jgi:hypothetical protein
MAIDKSYGGSYNGYFPPSLSDSHTPAKLLPSLKLWQLKTAGNNSNKAKVGKGTGKIEFL